MTSVTLKFPIGIQKDLSEVLKANTIHRGIQEGCFITKEFIGCEDNWRDLIKDVRAGEMIEIVNYCVSHNYKYEECEINNPQSFNLYDMVGDVYSDKTYLVIENDKRGMAKLKDLDCGLVTDWNAYNNKRFYLIKKGNSTEQLLLF